MGAAQRSVNASGNIMHQEKRPDAFGVFGSTTQASAPSKRNLCRVYPFQLSIVWPSKSKSTERDETCSGEEVDVCPNAMLT
jgi:hypothetical protein